jgi:hypothetical protein
MCNSDQDAHVRGEFFTRFRSLFLRLQSPGKSGFLHRGVIWSARNKDFFRENSPFVRAECLEPIVPLTLPTDLVLSCLRRVESIMNHFNGQI